MKRMSIVWRTALFLMLPVVGFGQTILFQESFDNASFSSRGWYDNSRGTISTSQHIPGSAGSYECRWTAGGAGCVGGAPARHKFTPTPSVYISFWIKHSDGWRGKGTHLTYLLTTADGDYSGLAQTHLNAYINEGTVTRYKIDLELQDALNIDASKINVDLTRTTEYRAAQGCNGLLDTTHDFVSCYNFNGDRLNMRNWVSPIGFTAAAGPYYMGDWHHVEAYYKLNDIDSSGKGLANGILRLWIDGTQVINRTTVHFRTGAHPNMLFNQFVLGPYMGTSEADQTIWIDELIVATAPPVIGGAKPSPPTNLR